jgi:hypothetical protein
MPPFKEVWIACKEKFNLFMEEVMEFNNAPFQDELDDILTNIKLYFKIVVAYARGHGKTTHLSVGYPLWRIADNHNIRILLVSSTASISQSSLGTIMANIDKNEKYQLYATYIDPLHQGVIPQLKGNIKAKKDWSGNSLTIQREDLKLRDPTICAIGVFGSILSKRADEIILDDIVNQENSQTEEQRLKIIDWIRTTVIPVLVPGGRIICLGNTWHQDDLVARLLKDNQFDYRSRKPAIIHESNHPELWQQWSVIILDESLKLEDRKQKAEEFYQANKVLMDDGVEVLWPDRFTYKDLYLIRLSDSYSFARMYQCDPSNRPSQKFKDEWLEEAIRKGAKLRLQSEKRKEFISGMTTSGVDLAIGEKEWNDDTSLLTLDRVKNGEGEIKDGDVVIRDIDVGKFSPDQVRQKIINVDEVIQPNGIRVENVGYQQAIVRDLENKVKNIRGYHTGGEKFDSSIGVNSLAILAEVGKLVIPYDQTDPRTVKIVNRLLNEMRAFPDGHTGDILMSLWFAYSEMRDLSGGRILVPTTDYKVNKPVESASELKDPVKVKEMERKADLQVISEQCEDKYQKEIFRQLMRGARNRSY